MNKKLLSILIVIALFIGLISTLVFMNRPSKVSHQQPSAPSDLVASPVFIPTISAPESFSTSATSPAEPVFATRAAIETQYAATSTALAPRP